jgi:ribonuclease D
MPARKPLRDAAGVAAVVEEARAEGRAAIDLEFMWERTYAPVACLAQVATPRGST